MNQPSKSLRVFVVDDEFIVASSLTLILRHKGFDAISFCGPMDALRAAQNEAPDLLISDVLMPRLSGVELAIQIQALYPHCKVVLFSGQASTVSLLEAAKAEGHDFELLAKPVRPSHLLAVIERVTENGPSRSPVRAASAKHAAVRA